MAINRSSNNPLYTAFANSGPVADLIVPATAVMLIALCGILLNVFVIVVTVRANSLRGTANFLMALICLCEVVHQASHSIFFTVVVTGINFVDLFTANLYMMPALFFTNVNMMLMVSAALDRLFAVAMPIEHKKTCLTRKKSYLGLHTLVSCLFGLYSIYYITKFSVANPGIPTTACISEILSGPVGHEYFVYTAVLNLLCLLCYLLIWAVIRCKNGVTKETNTRLLRSLVIIMLISVGCYAINLAAYQILFWLVDTGVTDPVRTWQLGFTAGILLNLGAAANAPILYLNSTEYRKAFKRELTGLAALCGYNGQQTSTSVFHVSNSGGGARY